MGTVTVKPRGGRGDAQPATPSQQLVDAANQSHSIADSKGRVLVIKKPDILAQFRLIEAIGDAAMNYAYRIMVLPVLYVVSIDGNPVPPLTEKKHVEALISRLGEHGFEAIKKAVAEHYPAADDEEDDAALKKS